MSQQPIIPPLGLGELEFATFHEGYLSRYIQLADAKAGTALVVTAGTLGYLLGQESFVSALKWTTGPVISGVAIASAVLLTTSSLLSFVVIAPRGSKPGASLVFWSDVARLKSTDFVDAVRAAGLDGLARERLSHSHALAGICAKKFWWLRGSLLVGGVGLVFSLAFRLVS